MTAVMMRRAFDIRQRCPPQPQALPMTRDIPYLCPETTHCPRHQRRTCSEALSGSNRKGPLACSCTKYVPRRPAGTVADGRGRVRFECPKRVSGVPMVGMGPTTRSATALVPIASDLLDIDALARNLTGPKTITSGAESECHSQPRWLRRRRDEVSARLGFGSVQRKRCESIRRNRRCSI